MGSAGMRRQLFLLMDVTGAISVMYIRCWGSRGSIPVSGKEYTKYGGDTTCLEVRTRSGHLIIIDAGTGIRRLGSLLCTEKLSSIDLLLTHAHWDHIMGFPFFKPLFLSSTEIRIHSTLLAKKTVRGIFSSLMAQPFFPVQLDDKDIRANIRYKKIAPRQTFHIGSVTIHTIALSHPKNSGLGYRFEEEGKSFCFFPDNELGYVHEGGCSFDEYAAFCKGADLLIHDGEYFEEEYKNILKTSDRPWGHSIFTDTLRLALKAGVGRLGLFHLNQARSDEQVDEMIKEAREIISAKNRKLNCFAVGTGWETNL